MNVEMKRAIDLVGIKRLAEVSERSNQAIYKYMYGTREVPPEVCVSVELATDGVVSRKDLRPVDWMRIWPELAETLTEENPE